MIYGKNLSWDKRKVEKDRRDGIQCGDLGFFQKKCGLFNIILVDLLIGISVVNTFHRHSPSTQSARGSDGRPDSLRRV